MVGKRQNPLDKSLLKDLYSYGLFFAYGGGSSVLIHNSQAYQKGGETRETPADTGGDS